jgi:hypothetical protein
MSCIQCDPGWNMTKSDKKYGIIEGGFQPYFFTYENYTCTKGDNSQIQQYTCYSDAKLDLNSACKSKIIYGSAPLPDRGQETTFDVGSCNVK